MLWGRGGFLLLQEQAADREDKELNQGVDRMEVLGLCVHCPLS